VPSVLTFTVNQLCHFHNSIKGILR
jgi:hypothetical protein